MSYRYPSDENTARVTVDPVRSTRPTFDDGEPLSSAPTRSMWRDAMVLLWIVVMAFIGFMGIAMMVGCDEPTKIDPSKPQHMRLVYEGWVFSEYHDDEHLVTCWKTYNGLSCLRDEAPAK